MTPRNRVRPGLGGLVLATLALLLLPGPASQAADPDREKYKEVAGDYETIGGAVNPAIGIMFKVFFDFNGWATHFGVDDKDPVADELKRINARLDFIQSEINALEAKVQQIQNDLYRQANLDRTRRLRVHMNTLHGVLLRLQQQPPDKDTKIQLADLANNVAKYSAPQVGDQIGLCGGLDLRQHLVE